MNISLSMWRALGHNLADDSNCLQRACKSENARLVGELLARGEKVEETDSHGRTALHYACNISSIDCVSTLLSCRANPNVRDRLGTTPLHLAAERTNLEIVSLLLDQGACHRVFDIFGHTPIYLANRMSSSKIVELFKARGASLIENDLHSACEEGRTKDVESLARSRDAFGVSAKNSEGETPLHLAIRCGHIDCAQILLSHGAMVDIFSDSETVILLHQLIYKETPLHTAARRGDMEAISLMLQHHATVDARVNDALTRGTSLFLPVRTGHIGAVEILLNAGADLEALDDWRRSPLHEAVMADKHAVCKVLIDRGAEVNVRDERACTPLHMATSKSVSIVELLLKRGANANLRDGDGQTPLHFAAAQGKVAVAELLKKVVDVDCQGQWSETPLHAAARHGRTSMVEHLCHRGTNAACPDKFGRTPLHWAAKEGHVDVVKVLLNWDAPTKLRDALGGTPLDWARVDRHSQICKLIMEHEHQRSKSHHRSQADVPGRFDPIEIKVMDIIADALGCDINEIDPESDLYDRRSRSHLDGIVFCCVVVQLEDEWDITIADNDTYGWRTIHDISNGVKRILNRRNSGSGKESHSFKSD
jgi:serine/threonine-protein phosphatase 6 regulatory ankyrin repeat subunit B